MKTLYEEYGAMLLAVIGGVVAMTIVLLVMFGGEQIGSIKDVVTRVFAGLMGGGK